MSNYRLLKTFGMLIAGLLTLPPLSLAQDSPWPDRSENLKVLPDTTGPAELRKTMLSFTAGLGVRCAYCHVGEEGQPLSTFDFASDEKGTKRVAREMLGMVNVIRETLGGLEDASEATVSCMTCHRRQIKPPPQLDALLLEVYAEEGANAAVERYDELHEQFYGHGLYDFSGRTFTRVARALMEEDKPDDAITVLARGASSYPDDPFIQLNLSDAYLAKQDTTMARIHIERAIALNPGARFLREKLRAIASH